MPKNLSGTINMKSYLNQISSVILATLILNYAPLSHAESGPFGDTEDIAFAEALWQVMETGKLVGPSAKHDRPYRGTHPHGAVLETLMATLSVAGRTGEVLLKRNYGGTEVSTSAVSNDRNQFIRDITVMFKREQGYDPDNQDWFWAKFKPDGELESNPRGKKLAGRVARGKPKGCIACHKGAPGGDFLFVK
jgi:hypothetical protein